MTIETKSYGLKIHNDLSSGQEIKEGVAYNLQLRVRFEDESIKGEYDEMLRIVEGAFFEIRWYLVFFGAAILAFLLWLSRRLGLQNSLRMCYRSERRSDLHETLLESHHGQQQGISEEPNHVSLLAVLVGTGTQLVLTIALLGLWGWKDGSRFARGGILVMSWFWILLTSSVGGFCVAKVIQLYGETKILRLYEEELDLFERELQLVPDGNAEDEDLATERRTGKNKTVESSMFRLSVGGVSALLPYFHLSIMSC